MGRPRNVDLCHRRLRGPMRLRRSVALANQIGSCVGVIVAVGYLLGA